MPQSEEGRLRSSEISPEEGLPRIGCLEVGADFCRNLEPSIAEILSSFGHRLAGRLQAGLLFESGGEGSQIIVDVGICRRGDLDYIDYTREQNEIMHRCPRTLRFAVESPGDLQDLGEEIAFFLSERESDNGYPPGKRGREESNPDPSRPEERFERLFIQAFGDAAMHALRRERPFVDLGKSTRYIDYALLTEGGFIGVELNGEGFHHPRVIGIERYRSQLFKQNSMVMSDWKVFRWSLRGMRDADRFAEEMRRFFGPPDQFKRTPAYMARRNVVFQRMEHQEAALKQIASKRAQGQSTFLVVLPTGTGKTEVFTEDFRRLKTEQPEMNGLILAPKLSLRDQNLSYVARRLPELSHALEYQPRSAASGFMVQTYQHMSRHYLSFAPDAFDYVVVDEAHHAVAAGLRTVLEHFRPRVLMGATATDERYDQKRLEEVFGSYETGLTLREAIERGLLPPIRAFRIETNIDLSAVRFNGVDYVQADLQRTLLVRSRDELVADTVRRYFSSGGVRKQGVVFCVTVRHAKEMAKLLLGRGITAAAVSGQDRKGAMAALEGYREGGVQFLCACELLSEGWDAPQTAVLVMARPTMSKVLYVQQLGRGTRSYPGKEALYVVDVVDEHGPLNAPWSTHALFGLTQYRPWADVVGSGEGEETQEQEILIDWLHEEERRVTEVDIFTFQDKYEGYLSEEQLARELFVSTGTVNSWVRKGEVQADVAVPCGARTLRYFAPEQVERIRELKGLKAHDETTQYEDFFEFLRERDYTFSYKMIFLLSLLTAGNARGEAQVEELQKLYVGFYGDRLRQGLPVDLKSSPYNREEVLADGAAIKNSILANPFEKFERKRFMHHCADLAYIAWHTLLWKRLSERPEDRARMVQQMVEDLKKYYEEKDLGGLGDTSYLRGAFPEAAPFLANLAAGREAGEEKIVFVEPEAGSRFKTCLPFYPLEIAAGGFAGSEVGDAPEPQGWVAVGEAGFGKRLTPDMFVSRVSGRSMLPVIPDGALCVFRRGVEGSREGRIVLVQKTGWRDPETRASFTVKRYHSTKVVTEVGWEHAAIELRPENKDFEVLRFDASDEGELAVVAEWVAVLERPKRKQ